MKKLLKKIAVWFGLAETNWWDEVEADPVQTIQGRYLLDALNHRRA